MLTEQQVKEVLADRFAVPITSLKNETRLRGPGGLGADELDMTELPMDLEDRFDIELTEEEVALFVDVKSVIDCVVKHVKK